MRLLCTLERTIAPFVREAGIGRRRGGELTHRTAHQEGNCAGAIIAFVPEDPLRLPIDLVRTATADASGKYTFNDIDPGDYRIYPWDGVDYSSVMNPEYRKRYERQSVSVTVAPRGDLVLSLKAIVPK